MQDDDQASLGPVLFVFSVKATGNSPNLGDCQPGTREASDATRLAATVGFTRSIMP